MHFVPDHIFTSTLIDDLRKQRTRLWIRTLILSLILGLFGICTMILAVLYGKGTSRVNNHLIFCKSRTDLDTATKTCAVSSAPTEISSTGGPTATVSKTVFDTWTVTATPDLTPAPSTFRESVTVWTTISPGSGEAEPVTELLTTTEFTTVHSTIVSTKTVTKDMGVTATKTEIAKSVTTTMATSIETSVETTTSVSTTTVTVSNQSG